MPPLRACQPFDAQNAFDEFLHFAATLSDHSHHDDVGSGVASHHAKQHALATPLPANRPMRCPRPIVSRPLIALTPRPGLGDRFAHQWIDRCAGQPHAGKVSIGPRPSSGLQRRPPRARAVWVDSNRTGCGRGTTRAFGFTPCISPVASDRADRWQIPLLRLQSDCYRTDDLAAITSAAWQPPPRASARPCE